MSPRDKRNEVASELRPLEFGRWAWRQLTSMRTALLLLLLLAIAAVPGSFIPQRGVDARAVQAYYLDHPKLAPVKVDDAKLDGVKLRSLLRETGRRISVPRVGVTVTAMHDGRLVLE